jgi:F-type H+-transporting ATPase subunit epsilon
MAKLKVDIVTPERRLVEAEADEVIAPGALGLFGVRPGHTPYLSVMQAGPLSVREGAVTTRYFVSGGFVEVGPSHVRVLADGAELAKDIDVQKAQARLADAEAKFKLLLPVDPERESVKALIAAEQKRIELGRAAK